MARRARSAVATAVLLALAAMVSTVAAVGVGPTTPAAAAEPQRWASISSGLEFTCGVTTSGEGYCWGDDDEGQLGNGVSVTGDQNAPTRVAARSGVLWASIEAGIHHACGVTTTGAAYCWGRNISLQLGTGSVGGAVAPSPVATPVGITWATISAGLAHTCAVSTAGAGYCWGSDGRGRLGNGSAVTSDQPTPTPVATPGGVTWASIDAGGEHSCGVTTTGAGYCWGSDEVGELGNGEPLESQDVPAQLPIPPTGWAQLTTGSLHTCGLTGVGTAYCWGSEGPGGRLGNGPGLTGVQASLTLVAGPPGIWEALSAGGEHTCGTTKDGDGYCWGEDSDGRLGNGPAIAGDQDSPSLVAAPEGVVWSSISAGGYHSCGVDIVGLGWCWGDGVPGAVGGGSPGEFPSPVRVGRAQAITFEPLADRTLDESPITLSATADSDLPVAFTASGDCTVSGTSVTLTAVGSCTVTATQAGDGLRLPAAPVERTFAIGPPANQAPTADAGPDQVVTAGATVTLDGTGSTDPDGDPLGWTWAQLSGPAVTISIGDTPGTATFVAPAGPATMVFRVGVFDQRGGADADTVTITVNGPPTADAGADQVVDEGDTVTLAGSGTDPDGDTLALAWSQTDGPGVTITGTDTATPSFTAPSEPAVLIFTLTVSDGRGGFDTDSVSVSVNGAPTADAGDDETVNGGDTVTLDGTGSSDPEGAVLTYAWTQASGPEVELTGAATATPSFTAPDGPSVLVFTLTASDGSGGSGTDTVTVTVNGGPTAAAGVDQIVNEGDTVTLAGSGTDPDQDPLTYSWARTSGPDVTLAGADTATATFTAPPSPAVLVLTLTVRDDAGGSATDTVTITVNGPPAADAGPDAEAVEGTTATLDGAGSSDPDDDTLAFSWVQTGGPAVTLTGGTTATPSFTVPTAPAVLTFALTVDDGRGATATDSVTITARPRFTADEAFVDHTYRVLLGRPSDDGGRAYWTGRLAAGERRADVARLIGLSAEATRGRVLDQRYQAWLLRSVDDAARSYWSGRLLAGASIRSLELSILASAELHAQAGGTSTGYVAALYQRLLGRAPDAGGLAHFADRLAAGATRQAVAQALLDSAEARRRRVGDAYQRVLDRAPTADELAFDMDQLRRTGDLRAVEIRLAALWVNQPGAST